MGAKGLKLSSILEETLILKNTLEHLSTASVVSWEKVHKKIAAKAKVIYQLKNESLVIGFTTLPRICRLDGTWGAICPPCLLYTRYWKHLWGFWVVWKSRRSYLHSYISVKRIGKHANQIACAIDRIREKAFFDAFWRNLAPILSFRKAMAFSVSSYFTP